MTFMYTFIILRPRIISSRKVMKIRDVRIEDNIFFPSLITIRKLLPTI